MKKSVFLAISFTKDPKIENALTKFFENKGFEVKTGHSLRPGKHLDDEIIRIIKEECDFGVVVYNELRHNISYEWGLLDALTEHVFVLIDENLHIELDKEISDKKGISYITFNGYDTQEKIIESLKEEKGLIDMITECLEKSISKVKTKEVSELAEVIASTNMPMKELQKEPEVEEEDAKDLEEKFEHITNLTAQGHFYKASAHYYAKEYEKAEKELKETIRLDPTNYDAHLNFGIILTKLKHYNKAEIVFKEAIKLNPDHTNAHILLGNLLYKINKLKEAEVEYREAIRLDPNDNSAHSNLGLTLSNLNRKNEAEVEYREAIRLDPNNDAAHNNLGLILSGLGCYDEAESEIREAIRLKPNTSGYYSNLGNIFSDLEHYDEAEVEYRAAMKINPDDNAAHNNLSLILFELGCYDEAESEIREAIRLKPNEFRYYSNLGTFFTRLQVYDKALKNYRKALKLNPREPGVYLNLSELYIILEKPSRANKFARDALKYSKDDTRTYILSRFMIFICKSLLGKKPNKDSFLRFLEQNKGYKWTFEFKTLQNALKDSQIVSEINVLIDNILKYSRKGKYLQLKQKWSIS